MSDTVQEFRERERKWKSWSSLRGITYVVEITEAERDALLAHIDKLEVALSYSEELENIRKRVEEDWLDAELWSDQYDDFQALFGHIEALDLNLRGLRRKGKKK